MVKIMVEDRKKFFEELIKFYKTTLLGTAESVKTLVDIEKRFPENYLKLKEATFNPEKIEEILASMTEEEKETFLLVFTKASLISRKLNKLFDLDVEEKTKLAKEIEDFVKFTERKLKELTTSRQGEPSNKETGE